MTRQLDVSPLLAKDELSSDIWDGDHLDAEVRKKLITIAREFIDFLEVDVDVKDILLTGSMANYNWSDLSDIDLHPLIDYFDIDDDYDLVRNLLAAKKAYWNVKYDVEIYGHDVELYAQDVNEPHYSSGMYSVLHDKWIVAPSHRDIDVDEDLIERKAEGMIEMIEQAIADPSCSDACMDVVKERIKKMRTRGLETGGEYSVENLTFKLLRREGWIDALYDSAHERHENELSLECRSVVGESVDPDELEEWRREAFESVKSLGSHYKQLFRDVVGLDADVWIHGSVLDPNEFSESSDVDIAFVIDLDDEPIGVHDEYSEMIAGNDELIDGMGGMVDAMVLNREEPYGRDVPALKIA